jgi:hypothetical protein
LHGGPIYLASSKIPKIPKGPDFPKIPDRPPGRRAENAIAKEIAKWISEHGQMTLLLVTLADTWLREFIPTIQAYQDPPRSLEELQHAVSSQKKGYDVHHIVEQSTEGRFSREQIDAPENLVLIPRLKHQEITGWYARHNPDYGGLSPRVYLRGKDWKEHYRVGLEALVKHGVLKR